MNFTKGDESGNPRMLAITNWGCSCWGFSCMFPGPEGPARARPTEGRRRGTGPSGPHCEVHGGQRNAKMHESSPREPRKSQQACGLRLYISNKLPGEAAT